MNRPILIVLGASARGLDALFKFFDHTLPDGVSYVITTHLFPHQKSLLSELLQKHSRIEVCLINDDTPIEINKVYVMPENKVMSIADGRLKLLPRDLSLKINSAIDYFFLSAAKDRRFNKVAIILSGMGKDGTIGVQALAVNGAYIIAQTPGSAGEESMPSSIIANGLADEVLSPKQMPEAIINYVIRSKDPDFNG